MREFEFCDHGKSLVVWRVGDTELEKLCESLNSAITGSRLSCGVLEIRNSRSYARV